MVGGAGLGAGLYALRFCQQRSLGTDGLELALATNLVGPFRLTKAVLGALYEAGAQVGGLAGAPAAHSEKSATETSASRRSRTVASTARRNPGRCRRPRNGSTGGAAPTAAATAAKRIPGGAGLPEASPASSRATSRKVAKRTFA